MNLTNYVMLFVAVLGAQSAIADEDNGAAALLDVSRRRARLAAGAVKLATF